MGYPDYPPPYAAPPDRGCLSALTSLLLVLIGGAILLIALVTFGVYQMGENFFDRAVSLFRPIESEPVVDTRAVVITEIRGASELTTAVFAMQAVADASKERTLGPFIVGETKLLYVAYGEVRAGVDLSEIDEQDITVVSDTVVIALPPPRILDRKIDVDRSYVYDFQQDILGPPGPELQSRAEQFALQQIVEGACENGLLETANEKAEIAVGSLLSAAGFEEVTVVTQPPPIGECPSP